MITTSGLEHRRSSTFCTCTLPWSIHLASAHELTKFVSQNRFGDHPADGRHSPATFTSLFQSVVHGCLDVGSLSQQLTYTACGATRSAGVGDITYSTCYSSGYFTAVFRSGTSSINSLRITGNLGADGQGSVTGGPLGRDSSGLYNGFYKTVHDGRVGDPTVNHLFIVPSSQWSQSFSSSSNSDQDTVIGNGVSTLVYVMFANPPAGTSMTMPNFVRLMDTVVSGCLFQSWQSNTQYNNVAGCNAARGCQWNQAGLTTETVCGANLQPPPTNVPTQAPTRAPSLHSCAAGQNNSCVTPSTFCSDIITGTTAPIAGGVGVGRYVCECNVGAGFVVRLSSFMCGTAAPTTASPTATPTSFPTFNPTATPTIFPTTQEPTAIPTTAPTASPVTTSPTGTASASSGASSDSGGGILIYIIIIAVAIVVAGVIIAIVLKNRGGGSAAAAEDARTRAQFENPM